MDVSEVARRGDIPRASSEGKRGVLEGEREGEGDVPAVVVEVDMLDIGREAEVGVGVVLFDGLPRCNRPCLNGDSVADGEDVECLVGGEVCECGCRGDVCGMDVGGCERVGVAMPALSGRGGDSVPSRADRGGEGCAGSEAESMAIASVYSWPPDLYATASNQGSSSSGAIGVKLHKKSELSWPK